MPNERIYQLPDASFLCEYFRCVGKFLEDNMSNFFPYFRLDQTVAMIALVAAVACAAVAAGIPAYRASKLDVIDALRRVG